MVTKRAHIGAQELAGWAAMKKTSRLGAHAGSARAQNPPARVDEPGDLKICLRDVLVLGRRLRQQTVFLFPSLGRVVVGNLSDKLGTSWELGIWER